MKNTVLTAVLLGVLLFIGCGNSGADAQNPVKAEGGNMSAVKVLMVIAHKDFRDEEYQEPFDALTKTGCQVTVASSQTGKASSMLGNANANPTMLVKDAKVDDYDMVIFVGGSGATEYFKDKAALDLAKAVVQKNKYIAAICIAPSILANAGLLKGKSATVYPSEKVNLIEKGASYKDLPVVRDGKIVTANGPQSAKLFAAELIKCAKEISGVAK